MPNQLDLIWPLEDPLLSHLILRRAFTRHLFNPFSKHEFNVTSSHFQMFNMNLSFTLLLAVPASRMNLAQSLRSDYLWGLKNSCAAPLQRCRLSDTLSAATLSHWQSLRDMLPTSEIMRRLIAQEEMYIP